MGLRYFYADQVKTLLLRWTFPCVAINFMIMKSKRCSLFHASFILWFTQLRMHWHQKWSENDITFLRSFFLFSLRKVDHMLRFTNITVSDCSTFYQFHKFGPILARICEFCKTTNQKLITWVILSKTKHVINFPKRK